MCTSGVWFDSSAFLQMYHIFDRSNNSPINSIDWNKLDEGTAAYCGVCVVWPTPLILGLLFVYDSYENSIVGARRRKRNPHHWLFTKDICPACLEHPEVRNALRFRGSW